MFKFLSDATNLVADLTEENSNLGARAVDVAHRTHDDILHAVGIDRLIPNPIRELTDQAWDTSRDLTRDSGHQSATFLRGLDRSVKVQNHEDLDKIDDYIGGRGHYGNGSESGIQSSNHPHVDHHDPRDFIYEPDSEPFANQADLRAYFPKAYDQLGMNSSAANAVAAALEFNLNMQHLPASTPSRLFIWYFARWNTFNNEAAFRMNLSSSIRAAIKVIATQNVCSEDDWTYERGEFDPRTKIFAPEAKAARNPSNIAVDHPHNHTVVHYHRIPGQTRLMSLIKCLDNGYPFLFGMVTYGLLREEPVFSTGYGLRLPTKEDVSNGEDRQSLLGVGYCLDRKVFIVRNSWGKDFGEHGYFYMPFELLRFCYDFWVLYIAHSPPGQ